MSSTIITLKIAYSSASAGGPPVSVSSMAESVSSCQWLSNHASMQLSKCMHGATLVRFEALATIKSSTYRTQVVYSYSSAHLPQLHYQCLLMVAKSARVEIVSQTVFSKVLILQCASWTRMNKTVPCELCCPAGSARQLHSRKIAAGRTLLSHSFTFVA